MDGCHMDAVCKIVVLLCVYESVCVCVLCACCARAYCFGVVRAQQMEEEGQGILRQKTKTKQMHQ